MAIFKKRSWVFWGYIYKLQRVKYDFGQIKNARFATPPPREKHIQK